MTEMDKLRDELVVMLTDEADRIGAIVAGFESMAFERLESLRDLAAQNHNVKFGGKRGGFSVLSFDGTRKVVYDVDAVISFNEHVSVARDIILTLVDEWTAAAGDGNANLAKLVRSAFEVDKDGHLSVAKILSLRRVNITDPRWENAMAALGAGIETNSTKLYLRCYKKDAAGKFVQIAVR